MQSMLLVSDFNHNYSMVTKICSTAAEVVPAMWTDHCGKADECTFATNVNCYTHTEVMQHCTHSM
jgi:hypothetical protein